MARRRDMICLCGNWVEVRRLPIEWRTLISLLLADKGLAAAYERHHKRAFSQKLEESADDIAALGIAVTEAVYNALADVEVWNKLHRNEPELLFFSAAFVFRCAATGKKFADYVDFCYQLAASLIATSTKHEE